MKKTERMVLFYDLCCVAHAPDFDAPVALSIKRAAKLMDMVPPPLRFIKRAKGAQTFYVSDWELTHTFLKILINKSDKSIPDPVFSVPSKGTRRKAGKSTDEGQDFSSHVVIRIPPDNSSSALMLVEQCPGISISIILPLLKRLVRHARGLSPSDFVQVHPDGSVDDLGNPQKYRVTHAFEADGHPSESFVADLDRGELQTLEMVRRNVTSGFDAQGYLVPEVQKLVLKPSLNIKRPGQLADYVLKLIGSKKSEYSGARLKFTVPDGKRPQTVDIDPDDGLPEKYLKKILVTGFASDLESSYDSFNDEMVRKMSYLART